MKLVIDAMGGDFAPLEIVKGCAMALVERPQLELVITGDAAAITGVLTQCKADFSRVEIVHAPIVLTNSESPTAAIKTKPDSSLVKAFDLLKTRDDIHGFIGAGSTGAILAASILKLGRIAGVSRPALAPILPTRGGGKVVFMDCGANMDTKPNNLLHFAQMGIEYMRALGVPKPRVALLNVGAEEGKGNALTKETFGLLKDGEINFVGNMEAREALSGDYDVVVCDGFAGNVLLKSTEGAVMMVMSELKKSIKSHFWCKIGAMFMKKTFSEMKQMMDYHQYGGSPFLGVKKLVIKSHGDSKANTISKAIMQGISIYENNVIEKIKSAVTDETAAE